MNQGTTTILAIAFHQTMLLLQHDASSLVNLQPHIRGEKSAAAFYTTYPSTKIGRQKDLLYWTFSRPRSRDDPSYLSMLLATTPLKWSSSVAYDVLLHVSDLYVIQKCSPVSKIYPSSATHLAPHEKALPLLHYQSFTQNWAPKRPTCTLLTMNPPRTYQKLLLILKHIVGDCATQMIIMCRLSHFASCHVLDMYVIQKCHLFPEPIFQVPHIWPSTANILVQNLFEREDVHDQKATHSQSLLDLRHRHDLLFASLKMVPRSCRDDRHVQLLQAIQLPSPPQGPKFPFHIHARNSNPCLRCSLQHFLAIVHTNDPQSLGILTPPCCCPGHGYGSRYAAGACAEVQNLDRGSWCIMWPCECQMVVEVERLCNFEFWG